MPRLDARCIRNCLRIALLGSMLASPASALVTIDWVTVGDPGNVADPPNGRGSVAEPYRIAELEITATQYAEFLNAVAKSDRGVNGDTSIFEGHPGGTDQTIIRSGTFGSFVYTVVAGKEQTAFAGASFYDAIRFANWMHNGQPVGDIGPDTTEDGAYTITAAGVAASEIERNPGAKFVLPTEDEWYKAAYYDAQTSGYFDYPAQSNDPMACSNQASSDSNSANCTGTSFLAVGSFPNATSPYGTLDQAHGGGEWVEELASTAATVRGSGSSFTPFHRQTDVVLSAYSNETVRTKFRLAAPAAAAVPSIGSPGLVALVALLVLACGWKAKRSISIS